MDTKYKFSEDDLTGIPLLYDMSCQKCHKDFSSFACEVGTGWSWNLYKCPNCGQLYAQPLRENGFIPEQVIKDESVICLNRED